MPELKTVTKVVPKPAYKERKSYYIAVEHTKAFQDLMGGLPRGTITGFLGAPEACKTVTAAQIGVETAISEGGNFLILDTENKFHQHLALASAFTTKFGKTVNLVEVEFKLRSVGQGDNEKKVVDWEFLDEVDPKATTMFLVHCPDIVPIMVMFGRGVELKIYDSGKFKVMMDKSAYADSIQEAPFSKFIEKNKIKAFLVDSVTNPLDEIPAVGENFPARADLTQVLMLQVHKTAQTYEMPIITVFHESKNETGQFSKQLKVEGGKGISYTVPFMVYMLRVNEPGLLPKGALKPKTLASNQRAMYVARHAHNRPWVQVRYLKVNETGMVPDGDQEDSSE